MVGILRRSLILIGTKMREKAEILNIPLHELGGPELPYHVVAINGEAKH